MKFTNEMDRTTMDQDLMMGRRLRPERWSEHFQDLSGWCQPNKMSNISSSQQSDEQLNTPIVTVQDEFDFGVRSTECPLMSEVDCDLWDTSIPNTQGELWDSVNDWLTYSPPSTVEDSNNMFMKKEIVKSDGDFLLSQSPLICKIKTEKTIKEPFIDIKAEEQDIFKPYCVKSENSSLTLNRPIKREPFFNIFQSEEPFINDMDSCTYTPDKLLSPIDIHRDDMVAAEEVVITTEEEPLTTHAHIPESTPTFMKPEPAPAPVKAEPTKHSAFVLTEKVIKPTVRRPKLELDIDAAMMTPQTETMDTPEVLQPLVEGIDGFSLLSYVCDDETNVLSAVAGNSSNQMTCLTVPPQKLYPESVKMPRGKYVKRKKHGNITEEIAEPSTNLIVSKRPKRKSVENFNKLVSKKRHFLDDSDDIESLNSIDTSILSDSDESFSLVTKLARKKYTNKSIIGRRRKISSVDSDLESVSSTTDRYRELRDRNNEASRKSRLNRKSKEIEMKAQAVQLEKENRLLKIKADEMERLVKKLRDNLMQIVLKRS